MGIVTTRQVPDDQGEHPTIVLDRGVDHQSTVGRPIAKNREVILLEGALIPQQGADPLTVVIRELKGRVVDPLIPILFLDQEADPWMEVWTTDHYEAACRVVTPRTEVPFQDREVDRLKRASMHHDEAEGPTLHRRIMDLFLDREVGPKLEA